MTAKTRRLRELLAGDEFLYMPSAATPLEGRLAEAMGTPLVYTGGYVSGASRAITDRRPRGRTVGPGFRRECGWGDPPFGVRHSVLSCAADYG